MAVILRATLAAQRGGVLSIEPTPDLAAAAKFLNTHLDRRDRCIVRAVGADTPHCGCRSDAAWGAKLTSL